MLLGLKPVNMTFTGKWKDDMPDGFGRLASFCESQAALSHVSGIVYEGHFRCGQAHGPGIYVDESIGRYLDGIFCKGKVSSANFSHSLETGNKIVDKMPVQDSTILPK